ncbi:hypothetical protein LUZ60_014364 [Juncus effusus]|nr:hypothetical protein LUZ60_014364 [Juncus effusus]
MDASSSAPRSLDPHVAALVTTFAAVPPAAIPAIIDCVLASSSLPADFLFSSVLRSFPSSTAAVCSHNVLSHVTALCHLIKHTRSPSDSLKILVGQVFIPVLTQINSNESELLNQIIQILCDSASKHQAWNPLEETLIPLCLKSVYLKLGPIQNNNNPTIYQCYPTDLVHLGPLQAEIAIHVLTSIMGSILRIKKDILTLEMVYNITWDLSNLVLVVFKQSAEYRSLVIRVLLPIVLCALNEVCLIEVFVRGKRYTLSRSDFLKNAWEFCASLFTQGNIERLHAYNIISLFFTFFSKSDSSGDKSDVLYLTSKKEFWVEIRQGLVDKDSSVRKKALYLLKSSLSHYFNEFLTGTKSTLTGTSMESQTALTKKERWADKEAKSMGVEDLCNLNETCLTSQERWRVFVLLYEMLEEYGTHLIEAAWTHQVALLIQSTSQDHNQDNLIQMDNLEAIFYWMTVLWERGFSHDNPHGKCLIMESFLDIKWEQQKNCAQIVPIDFVLGQLMRALNDVVHHKDFGIGGIYNSKTIDGATKFFCSYFSQLSLSDCLFIVWSLASAARHDNFGRAGLMTLSFCISSSSCHFDTQNVSSDIFTVFEANKIAKKVVSSIEVLDALGIVIERSKQHFNQNYRLHVCEKVLEATSCLTDIPLDLLLHFLSTIPREFTDITGPLRSIVQKWLVNDFSTNSHLSKELIEFPNRFINKSNYEEEEFNHFDDEDSIAWENEALRWARLVFIISQKQNIIPIFTFLESYGNGLEELNCNSKWMAFKFLIVIMSLIEELQRSFRKLDKSDRSLDILPSIYEKLTGSLLSIVEKLVNFAEKATLILWSKKEIDGDLPMSIKGKLGGPSQRRLASSITPSVLQAIFSMKAISSVSSWCYQFSQDDDRLNNSFIFLCDFTWRVIQSPTHNTETGAELHLAAFEALSFVLKSLCTTAPIQKLLISHTKPGQLNGILENSLDPLAIGFLESINNLLENDALTRSRRAVLMCWKWLCIEAILLIPYNTGKIARDQIHRPVLSDSALREIFLDTIESLENAGESSVLSILKCVRLVLGLTRKHCEGNSSSWLNLQMVMQLVKSSWILHQSCNKRRVAPIAALLSAVLHPNIFSNLEMHESSGDKQGPLKWFIEKILNEGAKSPRTIRLAALHLTGLWLIYPKTVKYYIEELKLLSLYGSVAFDEDFEGELSENQEARAEVSLLAQSPDCEFTEAFINTELYARVSVAVLFHKFTQISKSESEDYSAAFNSGKLFLLELIDSAVNDKDLAKELYKKYSSVHRRKVRAWQMICVLSNFVDEDIVHEVTSKLHICLYRNNLPAVRQYLETLGIQVYLKFPDLAEQQLIPILRDYSMRTQALSSYVFIAANVIIHSKDSSLQLNHLKNLLPPIIPLLTSHHHSLRGFTQLLVHCVLSKMWPLLKLNNLEVSSFERKCFEDLKTYLAENTDCAKLRASMEGFFDNFEPNKSASPAGVFSTTHEGSDFECAPVSLMDQVVDFLNEARDELRNSVAKDLATIKSESLSVTDLNGESQAKDLLDFQKKITLNIDSSDSSDFPSLLGELENEDQLFNLVLKSRNEALERIKQSQQNLILVASLIERIPNLAGLARTCEVFKAAGLAIADKSILQDKQFQLISVTAEKWLPIMEVAVNSVKLFLEKKRRDGYSLIGLEQTANSTPLDRFCFPNKTVLVLGKEKEGIPVEIIHMLDACVEIPQFGIIRSLNVHVSGAIAVWEYTRQQRSQQPTLTSS